jgi:hypothetical protein
VAKNFSTLGMKAADAESALGTSDLLTCNSMSDNDVAQLSSKYDKTAQALFVSTSVRCRDASVISGVSSTPFTFGASNRFAKTSANSFFSVTFQYLWIISFEPLVANVDWKREHTAFRVPELGFPRTSDLNKLLKDGGATSMAKLSSLRSIMALTIYRILMLVVAVFSVKDFAAARRHASEVLNVILVVHCTYVISSECSAA